jgi:integrase
MNKSGEQAAWVADYFDQFARRHIKTFATKKAAVAWLDEAKIEVKRGLHTPENSSITVTEAGELWLAQSEADGLEASTTRQYRQHLDYHINPLIGSVKLADLMVATVRHFRNTLINPQRADQKPRSREMAKKVVSSLGAILGDAMAGGRVARNVVREEARQHGARQRRLEKRHEKRIEVGVDIPTKDEIRSMLAYAQGRWRPLVVTAVFTGLRASELRGLRWDDVDLERAVLTVRQRADRWNAIGPPKSDAGKREIPLAPMVVKALREWKLSCPRFKETNGADGRLWLVFPNGLGNVSTLSSIHRRGLGPLQVAAGITTHKLHPKYGMHALRHAAASLFIEQGFGPKRIQVLMGHSTIQMTFDTYGHLFPSDRDDQVAFSQLQARLVG